MWLSFAVVFVVVVIAIGIIWLVASRRRPQEGFIGMYIDSVKAFRSQDETTEEFAVAHRDVAIGDVFSSFTPYDGDAYLTPEELNVSMADFAAAPGVDKVKRVADRWKKEHHVA